MYSQDSVLHIPARPGQDDRQLILKTGKQVLEITKEADAYPAAERDAHVRRRLDELDSVVHTSAPPYQPLAGTPNRDPAAAHGVGQAALATL